MANYKIIILTTVGCQGCSIAIENTKMAISKSTKPIELEVKTREEVGRKYLKYHDVKDFPTTMFWVNNQVKFKISGTKHPNMILRWIDLYLV